jgi:nucleotide-binding universal stress UspA family protein/predicted phosphoribosyltransferase
MYRLTRRPPLRSSHTRFVHDRARLAPARPPPVETGENAMEPIRNILVAIDFHAASLRALDYAAHLARSTGARLTILHSYDLASLAYPADLPPAVPPLELRDAAERELAAIVAALQQRGVDVKSVVRDAAPVNEILEAVAQLEADLVVVGTHGRRGLSRLVLGSVAEQIVRRSAAPVVTLHEWRFEDRAAAGRRLSRKLAPLRGELDVTFALARGAVPIAIDLARTLDTPVDVLCVDPIRVAGGAPIGAVCEDGSSLIDEAAVAAQRLDPGAVSTATDDARTIVREHAHWLADPVGPRSLTDARVLLVSDVLVAPAVALVAARAMSRRGAKRVSLAVPVCASSVIVALPPDIDSTLCVESTQLESPAVRVYHDEEGPSNLEAAEMLVRAGHRRMAPRATAGAT